MRDNAIAYDRYNSSSEQVIHTECEGFTSLNVGLTSTSVYALRAVKYTVKSASQFCSVICLLWLKNDFFRLFFFAANPHPLGKYTFSYFIISILCF